LYTQGKRPVKMEAEVRVGCLKVEECHQLPATPETEGRRGVKRFSHAEGKIPEGWSSYRHLEFGTPVNTFLFF
jgi:hypothetical protein